MVEEIRLSEKTAGDIWAIFGWMCMGSGLIWGFLSDRLGRRKALLWNNGIISFSVLLPLLFHQPFFLGLSAFLFGATFLGTVTIIAASIGDQVVEKKGFCLWIGHPDPWHRTVLRDDLRRIFKRFDGFFSIDPYCFPDRFSPLYPPDRHQ